MYCAKVGSVYTASKPLYITHATRSDDPGEYAPVRLDQSLVRPGENAPHHL